jgi:beta-glucanase (GH16 family)
MHEGTSQAVGSEIPGITFRTVLGGNFLGAQNDGGSGVIAAATVAQAWETFTLFDLNGGSLQSGDSVFIQAGNGQYWQALNAGGSTLNAASNSTLQWETFKVVKQTGSGPIQSGDIVGLQDYGGSWVSAQNGGGGPVFAYGAALGAWEQLKIDGLPAGTGGGTPPTSPGTISDVHFRTAQQNFYVGAQNDGGAAVTAVATVAQAWESFTLIDINGGSLQSGDSVFIQAGNGQFWQAVNGGGSTLNAASSNKLAWETFKVVRQAGSGTVQSGDVVGLQDSSGTWVSAQNGGGGPVYAYGGSLAAWEGFVFSTGNSGGGSGGLPGWTLTWSDEFDLPDGSAVDPNHWSYDTGGGGWGNNELEYYTGGTSNAVIQNGMLVITATTDGASNYPCWYGACQYTSARLNTSGKFSQQWGLVEARIQIPEGQGVWPAFWMLGDNIGSVGWPNCGEIDIMENIGSTPNTAYGTTHGPGPGNYPFDGLSGSYSAGLALGGGFHVYSTQWSASSIAFSVDGNLYFSVTPSQLPGGASWVWNQPFFLLLNLAVGGNWPGSPNSSVSFPQQMLVDYVRVYQPAQ